jgi:predicted nuclease of predicted toxin-antitoxin system
LKFLLDENFPLQLYRQLLKTGHEAEHIITLGQRGAPDAVLRDRLVAEELVLLSLNALK